MKKLHRKKQQNRVRPLTGIVKRHPDGFGFFIPDDIEQPDVYVPKKYMVGVMTNDKVEVVVYPEPGGERYRGEITEIIERSFKRATGQAFLLSENTWIMRDESHGWGADLLITCSPEFELSNGDWVSVDILSYPESSEGFRGKVVAVIGDALDPLTDAKRVLHTHEIPHVFSKEVLAHAEKLGDQVTEEDRADRKDLRELPLITIDGETAKDFDDAVCVTQSGQGFTLYVAIADVSHYVKAGDPIDREALARGTSTYFPNFVSPMLPEALSNELCSLKPDVDRLALVAEVEINFQGEMTASRFYEAVIRSHSRVTYGEAQEIIDGNDLEKHTQIKETLLKSADLARILMHKRLREGSMELNIPEVTIEVDETGMPIDIIKTERVFAHRLIEELMLMANVAVAKFLTVQEIPALYRIHDGPKENSIVILKSYMESLGVYLNSGPHLKIQITKALKTFSGKPQEPILNILTLRAMSQAKYSPENIGHFGLGFSDYVHFTSPIRRYPDLIIHRILKSVTLPGSNYVGPDEDELFALGTMTSECEQRSVKAEREIESIKMARFMEKFVGDEFEGMISSVTKFGVFVTLKQFAIDGLIKVEELGKDRFEFDERNLTLAGSRSGFMYKIGDVLNIKVTNVNIEQGQIDFVLGDEQLKNANRKITTAKPNRRKLKTQDRSKHKIRKKKSHKHESGKEDVSKKRKKKKRKGKRERKRDRT